MEKSEKFSLSRIVISNVTLESWKTIPHAGLTYNADVENLLKIINEYNLTKSKEQKISLNTALLKIISEALKVCPKLNSHLHYNSFLNSGCIVNKTNIDISMPFVLNDRMITVNLHNLESKSMEQIRDYVNEIRRKAENTIIDEALLSVAVKDTLKGLKKLKILSALRRLICTKIGPYRIKRIPFKQRLAYKKIDKSQKLTAYDLEQGTITVSNPGSIYKDWNGECTLLEIVPPQVVAIALSSIKKIESKSIITFTIAFDHRALDFGDIVPFMKKLDELFASKEIIEGFIADKLLTASEVKPA